MMFNYPFFGFRNKAYPYKYYNYPNYRYNTNYKPFHGQQSNAEIIQNTSEIVSNNTVKESTNFKTDTINNTSNEQFFSILGIHLYFDDLIILSLLFFLYNEGVKDEGLFICLILLLLS